VDCLRQNRPKRSWSANAFTLAEILIVLAIIIIIAAIVVPVLTRSKIAAYTSTHLSQMRQIGIARQLYMDQSDIQAMNTTKPLVMSGLVGKELLKGTWDPFSAGAGNQRRSYSPEDGAGTNYFDSVLVLQMYVGKKYQTEVAESKGAGWAVIQTSPPKSKKRSLSASDYEWFSDEYLRLRFDGGVVHRRVEYVSVGNSTEFRLYRCFTDVDFPELHGE
jgi:type II secretory pathway pseudopilin PulG